MEEEYKQAYANDLSYFWKNKGHLDFNGIDEALKEFPRVKLAYEQYQMAKRLLDLEIDDLFP